MTVYAVCEEFVRECCKDSYYALNVLYEFVKDNDKRIAVDRQQKIILSRYVDICKENKSQHMRFWLKQLSINPSRNLELIHLESSVPKRLFLEVARNAPKPRKLIVWSLNDYDNCSSDGDVAILDREDAKKEFGMSDDAKKRQVHSHVYTISAGHGTNIIIGSKLNDSVKYLETNVSAAAASRLDEIARCVEATGSQEAGDVLDELSDELQNKRSSKKKITSLVAKLFEHVPDMARISESVKETVEILTGAA